jgi:GNAT superfamily N-acetyltransferase
MERLRSSVVSAMNVGVGKLGSLECTLASSLLTRAFADDPIITWFLDGRLRRRIAYPAFFLAVLAEMLPSGHVYAAHHDGKLIGVAAWLPPGAQEPDARARRSAARQRAVVRLLFPRASSGLFAGFAAMEQFHPADPHWYLAFVGVEPTIQSHGIGRTLLAPVLEIADLTKTLCYLETPFPRTHKFYERLGFVRHSELNPWGAPQGAVAFVREPVRAERRAP